MSSLLQYRPLFSVEMLHDYYLSEDTELYYGDDKLRQEVLATQRRNFQISRDLMITPTQDCIQMLRERRLVFKQNNRGFFVGTQVVPVNSAPNAPFKPFIPLDEAIRLRFAVTAKNPYFHNMTNLRMEKEAKKRDRYMYYFSNYANNVTDHPTEGTRLYLNRPVPDFDPLYRYEAGEIIIEGLRMLEATTDLINIQPDPAQDTNEWKEIYKNTHTLYREFPLFSPNQTYTKGDIIRNAQGNLLIAVAVTTPGQSFNSTKWRAIIRNLNPLSGNSSVFSPSKPYLTGDIAIVGNGIFSANINIPGGGTPFNPGQWTLIRTIFHHHFQFITALDRVPLRPGVFRHPVSNETAAYTAVSILVRDRENSLAGVYYFEAQDPQNPAATLESCLLELGHLSPGIYRLEVQQPDGTPIPELSLTFYLDDLLYQQGPLALIECFHKPDGSLGDYRWLDETLDNQLLQPVYRLRWKNRPTFWRYYYGAAEVFDPALSDVRPWNAGTLNPLVLITNTQRGLTQIARRVEIQLVDNSNNPTEIEFLPNPNTFSIFPENGRVYSEINMGGGLGPPE